MIEPVMIPDHQHAPGFGEGAHIVCDNLVKIYSSSKLEVVALQGLDLVVDRGEMVAVVGASGSGKSTLLNILGAIDTPTAGKVRVGDFELLRMSRRRRVQYRRRAVGFVWQQSARNLLPYLTALENVDLPSALAGLPKWARMSRGRQLLAMVGMSHRLDHRPGRLSPGEQQRVALAVALANDPEVLLADEPTGDLDSATSHEVLSTLRTLNEELGMSAVVVSHDPLIAEHVDRTVAIRDGRTATEIIHRDEEGRVPSSEFAVLDRAGRLQLPAEYVERLGMAKRVKLTLEEDHVRVWPSDFKGIGS
ncbi:MAG: ABC transporter ATP-binding protein [Acidimicrobiia bacterium]